MSKDYYRIATSNGCWSVFAGGEEVAACANEAGEIVGLEEAGESRRFQLLRAEEERDSNAFVAEYATETWTMSDTVVARDDGFYEVARTWTNTSSEAREAAFRFELTGRYESVFNLIPCVSYNGNRWGTGGEPKGFVIDGSPWIFSYDRTGVPSATFSESGKYAIGLFVADSDERSLRSACSLEPRGGRTVHRLFWPEREGPKSYVGRDCYGEGFVNTATVRPGESFRVVFYLSLSSVEEPNTGWFKGYDRAAGLLIRETRPSYSTEEVWELSIRYAEEWLLQTAGSEPHFEMGYLPEGSHDLEGGQGLEWSRRASSMTEIGWCGQNATLALALIEHGFARGIPNTAEIGIRVLDNWERKSRRRNGLLRVTLDEPIKEDRDEIADVCNLAWGSWQFLNAYETLLALEQSKPQWLDLGIQLCEFFLLNYDSDFGFGHSWTLEGEPVAREGTSGAFLLLPLLKAYALTGQTRYLECAREAFDFYARRDLDRMQCTAGALDTDCIDKETCWPLLRSALDLFECTGETRYLRDAEKAGYYLLSWTYLYDAQYGPDSDFERYGYRTYGATSVSAQHHHLDPWGALLAPEWTRLGRYTEKPLWSSVAEAAWNNSLLGMSDGETVIHGMVRPVGSQNEAFYHCHWSPEGNSLRRGGMNDWLVAWPAAFRLTVLMESGQFRAAGRV